MLHNLISLNAHCIQEIYSLVPQDVLASKTTGHIELVENYIVKNVRSSAWTLLRLAKNNNAIKTEFSVFKNLFESTPQLSIRQHNIHKVFMNIYYTFFSDFSDKDIKVNIQQSQATAHFDYESISVALHYMIENTAKYILPKTNLQINIFNEKNYSFIVFDMLSIQIKPEEITSIFEEGFSGSIPEKIGKAGSGIGMHRVARLLDINGGDISVKIYPETLQKYIDIPYQRNEFTIMLKNK